MSHAIGMCARYGGFKTRINWRRAGRAALALMIVAAAPTAAKAIEGSNLKIVALGDSLTAGYGLDPASAFPAQLEAALKEKSYEVVVENAGVSGDTTAGGRARLDWALGTGTDAVIVGLGANDALRGRDPAEMAGDLDAILATLRARNLPVLLAGMRAPPNLGPDYAAEYDPVFARLAEKHGALFYPFFLDGVAADPALNQADGIHPNSAGVAVIVARILPAVERLIAQIPGP